MPQAENYPLLKKAREMYYKATEEEEHLKEAQELFTQLKSEDASLAGLAETYLGSLKMLEGKYAFWPNKKLSLVNEGFDIMEAGIKKSPRNIEALFIYGTTCYYLPFFLGKSDEAEAALKRILFLLRNNAATGYDPELVVNAMKFIRENIELDNKEIRLSDKLIDKYSDKQ
ncbi:MAG: hypothetical protein ACLFR2_06015 [Candidatus Kapaibacterium sp.]